jgi:beta-1,4-mannosyltransferase
MLSHRVFMTIINIMTKRVGVIVLGDIGRSPRMQYHAESISGSGIDVEFIGYKGRYKSDLLTQI